MYSAVAHPLPAPDRQPRAQGSLRASSKLRDGASVLDGFRCAGSFKGLFPRSHGPLQLALINTSGGLTGGDRFQCQLTAGQGSALEVTTQAAERAYRATSGVAQVDTVLRVEHSARLHWMPQELILFAGSALRRNLRVDLDAGAELLLVEPVVFGRTAMGERLTQILLRDRIEVWRGETPLYCDHVVFDGNLDTQLSKAAVGAGVGAMASVVFVRPDAEVRLGPVRALLPVTGGASMVRPDVLVIRLVAQDGFDLRRSLIPILELLKGGPLPRPWSL